jgi:BASS family bile acid:Na+ symporter
VAGVIGNLDNLLQHLPLVFWWVLLHNGLALLIGYIWPAFILRLPTDTSVSISLETGIQNSGLALLLVFAFFKGNGGMALMAAWWSIWHLISALAVALVARKTVASKVNRD